MGGDFSKLVRNPWDSRSMRAAMQASRTIGSVASLVGAL